MSDHPEAKDNHAPESVKKKAYVRPTLKKYGDVTQLTQGTSTDKGDSGGLSTP